MKALAAGKHVLLEKPSADTAEETRKMFESAEKKGVVLMEAFHYRSVVLVTPDFNSLIPRSSLAAFTLRSNARKKSYPAVLSVQSRACTLPSA